MDKRISTLIFIYVIYLIIALTMVFSSHGQEVLTMLLFGGGGIGILIIFYIVWQQARTKE
jgi:CHASE1-domain containing sensor protein